MIKTKNKKLNNKKPLRTLPGRIHKSYLGMNVPRIDFWMVLPVIILLTFGVLMVFSASYYTEISKGKSPYSLLVKNSILVIGGVISMLATSFIDYKIYKKYSKVIAIASLVLLLMVFTPFGVTINGATRWLKFGITVMPGEISKLAIIIFTASKLSMPRVNPNSLQKAVMPIGILLVAYVGLIMKQPNMSTAMTIIFVVVGIFFIAGMKLSYFGGAIGLVGFAAMTLMLFGGEYRVKRFTGFLDPFNDPTGDTYQVVQSLLALGSGGILGKGPGQSIQKALYLPEGQTDFILAIIGEELGFVGICIMTLVFALLIARGLKIALDCRDRFGMLLASGIMMMIGIQLVLNIAIVTSSMPATGVALPFVSYGGNATIIYCSAIGIVLNIARQNVGNKKEEDFIG